MSRTPRGSPGGALPGAAVAIGLVALVASCATAGAGGRACSPPAGEERIGLPVERFAGRWELTLVATSGPRAGDGAAGRLELVPMPDALREPAGPGEGSGRGEAPLYGTLSLELSRVAAIAPGTTEAADPEAPGVLVLALPSAEPGGDPRILLRLGSVANDRSRQRFDGAYTALTVHRAGEKGFGGTWASGVEGEEATGYFCARRP